MHVLSKWLPWKPRRGSKIWIDEDPIIGKDGFYKLSKGFLKELNDRGITYLLKIFLIMVKI